MMIRGGEKCKQKTFINRSQAIVRLHLPTHSSDHSHQRQPQQQVRISQLDQACRFHHNHHGLGIAGLWPPMQSVERFPGATIPAVQPSMSRPELGPSLLPASEAQTLTQLFGVVAQQHQQTNEEAGIEHSQEMQPHQQALFSQLNLGSQSRVVDSSFAYSVVGSTAELGSNNASSEIPTMFNQVHQLRINRQENINTGARSQVPSAFMPNVDQDMSVQRSVDPRPTHQVPTRYEGDEDTCSICQLQFAHRDVVCRLPCRHVFHQTCIDEMIARDDDCMPKLPRCFHGHCHLALHST